ncbi:hypothetical protein SASPL_117480 [Salvia splendens]|uniref:Ribosomal protein L34Ae n=1 Tax=Salvia splendens TaxID=180675 RepID=A0A8X8XXL7_SALSN|nr:uncharacterized protein LOC121806562 [Salvia splendens]KAG6420934.1 hypothetical protein SASPL_117480 [Salvia splendens]
MNSIWLLQSKSNPAFDISHQNQKKNKTNLQFLNMNSNSCFLCQKLVSLFHAISLFLLTHFFSYFSRCFYLIKYILSFLFVNCNTWLKKSAKKDVLFLEAGRGEENELELLHLKFKFPSFDEFRKINTNVKDDSCNLKLSSSALIELLTTFPLRHIDEDVELEPREEEATPEFNVNLLLQHSVDEFEISSDGEALDSESFGVNTESLMFLGESKKVEEEQGFERDFNVNSSGDMETNDGELEKECSPFENDGVTHKLECLWEHQELIEQLQMELEKVKATGLPTIVEESETPKVINDLKPWKIDETEETQHRDCIAEPHKSYREMMRKFDILNYQKMYAMGFVQQNDPFQQKVKPAPMLKSLVSKKLWTSKHKKQGSSPMKKLMNELQGDVEVVYVGQMCLSWEILQWEYDKALELWNSDPHSVYRYNEVVAEFQQFQVLLLRFIEDEPFQGGRVQTYVKARCVLRNLLQVPLVREDDRTKERDEYVISSEMLVEMLEESIRIFWEFVRSDKDCGLAALPVLHSPQDLKMLMQLRRILQKKERRVKDMLRSEKCILRRFQKQKRRGDEEALHFFAQVDVKLVSRVLSMSRISREQLIWCENKLSRISFVGTKIYVQPAFLLFPC